MGVSKSTSSVRVGFDCEVGSFFIAKPGPVSTSEALVMGLALIVERNRRTLVQERFNTEWIVRKQLGSDAFVPGDRERGVDNVES